MFDIFRSKPAATFSGKAEVAPDSEAVLIKRLIDDLQNDLRNIASETRRKFPQIKDAAENTIRILRTITSQSEDTVQLLLKCNNDLVHPFLLGCNTKIPKVVSLCIGGLQKLVTNQLLIEETAAAVVSTLWSLMEIGVEELRLLQTTILLITTNSVVKDKHLAKALVLCFRLHFTKNSATINTAAATIRQCAGAIFERAVKESFESESKHPISVSPEDEVSETDVNQEDDVSKTDHTGDLSIVSCDSKLRSLKPCSRDAYQLFRDLCLLVNGESPIWLQGLTEMTRTLGLEILESILLSYSNIFQQHEEFAVLLKEQVCPLIIKLFSPSLKFKQNFQSNNTASDKASFAMVCRLIRLKTVIIKNFFCLLNTECEIFLSLLMRFLESEKPLWQRALALEVLYKIISDPSLVKHICESYDMKEHSNKIFKDLVNAISSFIQSSFINTSSSSSVPKDSVGVPPAMVGGLPVGPGVSPQSGFAYRGNWIPLYTSSKVIFYDMLDKSEASCPPDGYALSLGYLCLVELVRSLQVIADPSHMNTSPECQVELMNASWCGALAGLSLLLETSTDESATESILRSLQTLVSLCGNLGMLTPRDAFVTALCKASLPTSYALVVLSTAAGALLQKTTSSHSAMQEDSGQMVEQSQVVVVGSGLPLIGSSSTNGPIMLTAKNIQCMRAILNVAHCYGGVLGTSWHLVLTTLQHLVWILGLKVTPGKTGTTAAATDSLASAAGSGSVTNSAALRQAAGGGSVITTAVMADMMVLSNMLVRLFESSQYLDEVALHHLIDALCKLSNEAMEIAYSNKEPSLFAVAKLMETGQVNIGRIEVWWKPVYAHLLEVCQHTHQILRQLGADALVSLVKSAIQYNFEPPFWRNAKLNALVLHPLSELSNIPHNDVCQKQLDCVQYILHSCGEQVGEAWLRIIRIVGSISDSLSEQLVRNAFQCLQLIITDYLSVLQAECYPECVMVAAKFAHQKQDLNIALTAVGSIWHITDYFYQHSSSLRESLSESNFDALWICVHTTLSQLCVDSRPAVRKSSGQTLFNTIDSHGKLLQNETWNTVLWKVLFPLLESVQENCLSAPQERELDDHNILMHHSRDTAAKQWAETHVMALAGVAHVFTSKQIILLKLDDFLRAWKLLLECIEESAMSDNAEISLNALKSFQEAVTIDPKGVLSDSDIDNLWSMTWQTWLRIGEQTTQPQPTRQQNKKVSVNGDVEQKVNHDNGKPTIQPPHSIVPQQAFLSLLLELFPYQLDHVAQRFALVDLQKLCSVIGQSLSVPPQGSNGEPILPVLLPSCYQDTGITPLQTAALKILTLMKEKVLNGSKNLKQLLATYFMHLLDFTKFAVHFPKQETNGKLDSVAHTFVNFGEKCMDITVDLYKQCASEPSVIQEEISKHIILSLQKPLSLKYNCPAQSTWKLAHKSLIDILIIGVPVARKHTKESEGMWTALAETLKTFLFNNQKCLPGLSLEEFQKHQTMDCQLIYLIRDQFLSNSDGIPHQFIESMIQLLNIGSIHSPSNNNLADLESSRSFREDLAQLCFQTLLEYSFQANDNESDNSQGGIVTRTAVKTILQRCSSVLQKYVEDERLSGKCPLPRARLSEVGFVLKALSTLLSTFKNAPKNKIDKSSWSQVIDIYPQLVDCVSLSGGQFMKPLRSVLHQYKDLLKPY